MKTHRCRENCIDLRFDEEQVHGNTTGQKREAVGGRPLEGAQPRLFV